MARFRPVVALALGVGLLSGFALSPAPAEARPAAQKKAKLDLARLKADLESGDETRILSALDTIEKAGDPKAAPLVEALLARGVRRKACVRALEVAGSLKQQSSSAAIAPYVRHRRSKIRHAAVKALIRTKGPIAIKTLRHALHSSDAEVRGIAASGLGSLGAKQALPDLFIALDHRVGEAAGAIGQLCEPTDCEKFAARLGKQPFDIMVSGFDQILFRPAKQIPDDEKIRIIGRLRELGTKEAGKYLADVAGRWPKGWSKRVKQAIDAAVKATGSVTEDDN